MKPSFSRTPLFLFLLLLLLPLSSPFPGSSTIVGSAAAAAEHPEITHLTEPQGYVRDRLMVVFADGPVFFNRRGQKHWRPLTAGQNLTDGDAVRTADHGYLVLSFSADNLLLIKPKSGVRFEVNHARVPVVRGRVSVATLMLSVRDSQSVTLQTPRAEIAVAHGDVALQSNDQHDILKTMHGTGMYRLPGATAFTAVAEGCFIELDQDGKESGVQSFAPESEYHAFRRFATWLKNFSELNQALSTTTSFKVGEVQVNGKLVSNLEVDRDGFAIIDPGAGPVPQDIHLKLKLSPYPGLDQRFEVSFGKDLAYALREGRDGFWQVRFRLPAFPEFHLQIFALDQQGRRERIFQQSFIIFNRRRKIEEVKEFLRCFAQAFERRDIVFLRDHLSRDYRDSFGNTYFDFTKTLEETYRRYRDLRLRLHPHTFVLKQDCIQVNLNYRISALTDNWTYRYEDLGADEWSLLLEGGKWRIRSKTRGLFFQRMKVAVDPRLGVLRGKVVDERTGTPLSGATVKILKTPLQATTNRMGEYMIYHILPGRYDVEIQKTGYGVITATQVVIRSSGERF